MTQLSSGASSKQHDASLQTSVQKRPWLRAQRADRSEGGGGIITALVTEDGEVSVLIVELVIASIEEIVSNAVFSVDVSYPGIVEFEYCVVSKLMAVVSFEKVLESTVSPSTTMLVFSNVKLL